MSYIHTDGVEYSDDKKTLVRCPKEATEIIILDSVTSIGEGAFYDCSGLTSIVIPDGVTSTDGRAFSGCSGLTSISVDVNNPKYDSRNNCNAIIETETNTLIAGCKNTIIPDSVTSIGNLAFYRCSGLTPIVIPDSVTSIGDCAFSGCSGLTSIVVDKSNPKYDSRNNCNAIIETETNALICGCQNTTIPEGVTSIWEGAFYDCSGLTSIVIPDSVTSIEEGAFSNCSGLTSLVIPKGVTSIGDRAFEGCSGLTSLVIPEGVTSIGRCAFEGCSGLTSLVIPESVTSIGDSAFRGCSGLTSLVIPESVKKRAFVAAISAFWGYDDDTIDSAFEGDPELTWNVD